MANINPTLRPKPEALMTEYTEVCQSYRAVTDFRAKLLTLLPIASGTGLFLLLKAEYKPVDAAHFPAIGLFGFLATLGLFFHELHAIGECWALIQRGRGLEIYLRLDEGQFGAQYSNEKKKHRWFHRIIGPEGAAWVIYMTTMWAWLYLVAIGICPHLMLEGRPRSIWGFWFLLGIIWFLMVPIGFWLYCYCQKTRLTHFLGLRAPQTSVEASPVSSARVFPSGS